MITLQDLGLAYRKAKVDLYYSSHASIDAIAEYEENLIENLSALLDKINGASEEWVRDKEFLGTYTIAAKSIDMSAWKDHQKEHGNGLTFSSAADEWAYVCAELANWDKTKKPIAEFRVMAKCSLDFHVLSTLWMLEVGQFFDAKLSNAAYGNRLRRTKKGEKKVNPFSLGTFKPYLKPFKDWRDQGIKAMRSALNADKKIVALTADIKSFYHELNPGFMLDSTFVTGVVGVDLNDDQKKLYREKLHRLFITALQAWAQNTPLKKGLPVGLPASAVVANMALIELDAIIEKELVPLYYGRYVDDILLVMENGSSFRSKEELWAWIFKRFDERLAWVDGEKKNKIISFQPTYLREGASQSQIHFANDKNKVFMLSGPTGKTLVEAIEQQIYERASEWRAMPRLPRSSNYVGTDLLAATQSDGEAADNLRKTDALTMRRAGFAIKLRDYEAYERDLHPDAWKAHRHAFLEAFIDHVLVLPHFFDLAVYLPRVVRLATACEDFGYVRKIINALNMLCIRVKDDCEVTLKSSAKVQRLSADEVIKIWKLQLFDSIRESIAAAIPPQMSKDGKLAWIESMDDCLLDVEVFLSWYVSAKAFQAQQARLFSYDLAHLPFRFIGLPKEMVAQRGIPARKTIIYFSHAEALLSSTVIDGNQSLAYWINLKKGSPNGLLFSTRPFNIPELFILNKDAYAESARADMQAVVSAVRGFELGDKAPMFDKHGVLQIPDGSEPKKYGIAVSSWKTRMDSWSASVMRMQDPDVDRYARLCRLLDIVIAEPRHSRYLILPELALPAHWFMRIARKLQGRGISLISGIEYLQAPKKVVRNQVWAALSHDGLGFPSLMVYRQDKQAPALHEETELQRLAGLEMKPQQHKIWKNGIPPIVQHGEFRFAMLICSELTNISYRAALRGRVDALFVPEWNQDTETFNALVESAALDMHAYIIQCNNRQYGDSRIRAPFKDSWLRDVLRVKGGATDYCVIGEIDVQALRRFQSSHRSASKPFKPVPDGFEIDVCRKVLTVRERE